MDSPNEERRGLAASSIGFARLAYKADKSYAHERVTFGKKLIQHQVVQHKLVDMAQLPGGIWRLMV